MPREPKKSLDEVIREVGCYPPEAFMFVQECIGAASDRVHAPMTPDEAHVAHWMREHDVGPDELTARYSQQNLPEDIAEVVERVGGPARFNRHVTGSQLCWAVRDVAVERWGLMARSVLARWNIRRTEDIGQIVFALVDNDWLQKQPTDSIDDFNHVFDFTEAFDNAYRMEV